MFLKSTHMAPSGCVVFNQTCPNHTSKSSEVIHINQTTELNQIYFQEKGGRELVWERTTAVDGVFLIISICQKILKSLNVAFQLESLTGFALLSDKQERAFVV